MGLRMEQIVAAQRPSCATARDQKMNADRFVSWVAGEHEGATQLPFTTAVLVEHMRRPKRSRSSRM
jgi:hypothetical protein